MATREPGLMEMLEEKAHLAGSNEMELLLFSLGGAETYGINVFKVREVCAALPITRTPNMPRGVEGIVSLRGAILPVVGLARLMGVAAERPPAKMIITEFSGHTQAFLVEEVDRIVRVAWNKVLTPHEILAGGAGSIIAVTEIAGGRLVSILDVEQILAEMVGDEQLPALAPLALERPLTVLFADDSAVARKKIVGVLEQLRIPYQQAVNGRDAWAKLDALAAGAAKQGVPLATQLGCVLVDAEMPEMDGYVLTRTIKADARFAGVPVVMHSSLSAVANRKLGQQVGVDHYVAKFHPDQLGAAIATCLARS